MDENESPEGQNMLQKMTGAFLFPWPKKPVGPSKASKPFAKTSSKPQSRHARSQRSHVKGKKNVFGAGWD